MADTTEARRLADALAADVAVLLRGAIVAASVLAAAMPAHASCAWNDPGADPYHGDAAAAVQRLTELPPDVRRELADMVRQRYGGRRVLVTRDQVDNGRLTDLRHMNSGAGRVCHGPVDRSGWPAGRHESGRAYVVGRWAVVQFDSCNNVAMATNAEALPAASGRGRAGEVAGMVGSSRPQVRHVPEPRGLVLVGTALVALAWLRCRYQRAGGRVTPHPFEQEGTEG